MATMLTASGNQSRRRRQAQHDAADQHALDRREDEADERRTYPIVSAVVAESPFAENRERRFEAGERGRDQEVHDQQQQEPSGCRRGARNSSIRPSGTVDTGRPRFRQRNHAATKLAKQSAAAHHIGAAGRSGSGRRRSPDRR